jgi:hypothetical protein
MSISTYFRLNIHQNGPEILEVKDGSVQGSFFRLQNTEGLTLVGLFMEGTTLTCLKTYSDTKKRTLVQSYHLLEMVQS